jgi:aldehyde:ferredoxin oxidoreductase
LTAGELREMIGGYYQVRGLNEDGFVPVKKLQELELSNLRLEE